MDYFEKGSPVRQHVTQQVHNDVSFLRKVQAKNLNVENFSTSTPIPEFHLLDVGLLFDAITADPFSADDWKASFTDVIPASGVTLNGQFETDGDFSTETSNWKIVGIVDEGDGAALTSILGSANFQPTDGTVLGGIEISNSYIRYSFDNIQWTYKYEEDPTATGSDPKYLHDFRLTIDSTQILGYVVINADDSISANNFVIDSPSS
jgi:hypothetical protein